MAIDSHTVAITSTSPVTVDPPLAELHPDSYKMLLESSTALSLKLDIPSVASSAVSSEPPTPSSSLTPLAADSGSGSTTTHTSALTASPHTSLSASPFPSLSSSPSSSFSSSSLPPVPTANLSVKFAPLPKLGPRKRRSTAPLGMAARGQLMRGQQRRRVGLGDTVLAHSVLPPNVVLTPAELEELRLQQEAAAARYALYQGSAHAIAARETEAEVVEEEEAKEARARERAEREREKAVERERGGDKDGAKAAHGEEGEDPLLGLGKAVKGVGRFWRRRVVSKADAEDKDGERGVIKRRKSDIGQRSESSMASSSSSSSSPPPVPPLPLRPILANITTNVAPQSPVGDDAATIVPRRRAKTKTGEGELADREDGDGEDERGEEGRTQEEEHEKPHQNDERERQHDEEEQGGVWEEEIGDGIPLNAGQTQTIVGGRVVASVVSVASSPTMTSPSTPTPPSTTTTTTIEMTATATAAKTHGKTHSAGKADGARLVKTAVRSSLIRKGKPQVGSTRA